MQGKKRWGWEHKVLPGRTTCDRQTALWTLHSILFVLLLPAEAHGNMLHASDMAL